MLALLSPESVEALKQAKGTPEFPVVRKTVWEAHKNLPKFPAWETFKRLLDAALTPCK